MTEPAFIKIIHPETGNVAEVPESSQATWWRSGWAPLREEDAPPPEAEPEAPPAVSAEEVAATQAAEDKSSRKSSGKTTKE